MLSSPSLRTDVSEDVLAVAVDPSDVDHLGHLGVVFA